MARDLNPHLLQGIREGQRVLLRQIARRQWILECASLLALAAAGCRRGRDRASSGGSSVTIAYCCGVEDVLNPWEQMSARYLLFLPLARFNEQGELEGRLAKGWEHSPDYREWMYDLRTDVRWHDGVPVTAHDIKFTLDTLSHPDVQYFAPSLIESTTVIDDATVKVRFGGYPEFFAMASVFYPKHLLSHLPPKRFYQWDFWKRPVGNGPYRFVRRLPKTMMEFEANPDYYRGKPKIDRVILKFIDEAGLTDLLGGGADAVTFSNPAQIPKLANDPRFRVYHRLFELVSRAIYWNNAHPLFDDARVRRALTLAINRRELLRVLNLPENFPVVDGIYTDRQLRRGQLPEPLPYDPARARGELEAAGWRDRDGDGVRERGGKAFRFTAILPGAAGFTEMAVYVQDQLRRVGVRMEVQPLDAGGVVGQRLQAGRFEAAFFQFRNTGWWLERYFGKDSPIGYTNRAVSELIGRSLTLADPDERDRIYQRLTALLREDLPVTFLHPRVETYIAHRRLKGLSTPFRADPVWYMEHLWIDDRDSPR